MRRHPQYTPESLLHWWRAYGVLAQWAHTQVWSQRRPANLLINWVIKAGLIGVGLWLVAGFFRNEMLNTTGPPGLSIGFGMVVGLLMASFVLWQINSVRAS